MVPCQTNTQILSYDNGSGQNLWRAVNRQPGFRAGGMYRRTIEDRFFEFMDSKSTFTRSYCIRFVRTCVCAQTWHAYNQTRNPYKFKIHAGMKPNPIQPEKQTWSMFFTIVHLQAHTSKMSGACLQLPCTTFITDLADNDDALSS